MKITFINNHDKFSRKYNKNWATELCFYKFTSPGSSNYLVFVILGVGFIIYFYK